MNNQVYTTFLLFDFVKYLYYLALLNAYNGRRPFQRAYPLCMSVIFRKHTIVSIIICFHNRKFIIKELFVENYMVLFHSIIKKKFKIPYEEWFIWFYNCLFICTQILWNRSYCCQSQLKQSFYIEILWMIYYDIFGLTYAFNLQIRDLLV